MAWGEAGFHEESILDKASQKDGKLDNFSPLAQPLKCPQCCSIKLYKDGLRYLGDGTSVQRWLCRECSYRFTEKKPPQKKPNWQINSGSDYLSKRQVCELLTEESKNLAIVETRNEKAAGATSTSPASTQILDYAWQMKKQGLAESTIKQRVYRLKHLNRKGANLMDPDSVLTVLATNNWSESNKQIFIVAYQSFVTTYNLHWKKPKTRVERKIPFIPSEELVDQLIAGCGKKMATFLQTLKDTAARTAEAAKIKWSEIDEKQCTIRSLWT